MNLSEGDIVVSTGNQEYIVAIVVKKDNGIILEHVYGYWKDKYSDIDVFEKYHGMRLVASAPKNNETQPEHNMRYDSLDKATIEKIVDIAGELATDMNEDLLRGSGEDLFKKRLREVLAGLSRD